jgi:hypothetical protein
MPGSRALNAHTAKMEAPTLALFRLCRTLVLLLAAAALPLAARAATSEGLPNRGPIAPYLMDRQAEIALARSAAPSSISAGATVLVFTSHGYETAVNGTNGWVCLIERSWNANYRDTEFWNPKERGPDCLNPPAARTEIPYVLKQAQWALAGLSAQQIMERTKAAEADGTLLPPEPGAFGLMLSKEGYLNHARGPWQPHVMLFVARNQVASWGTLVNNAANSPVDSVDRTGESTLIMIPVLMWSDGSPAPR